MSRIVEHLVELTGFRDRDVLDVTLVAALKDLLRPQSVAIYRCVGEVGAQRWLTRARLGPKDVIATADPIWTPFENLPALASQPDRQKCLQRQEAFNVRATPAMAYFPLVTEREPIGVLEIATTKVLSPEGMRLASSILRIYRNFQGLLDYSERDTLTGLLNRKTFDENFLRVALPDAQPEQLQLSGEPRRQAAAGESWLGVIDIDHFKRVNDEFGHLIGDEVLLLLSRLMRSSFRFQDHLYRFGGEEFVVMIRCASADDAWAAFERMRANVMAYSFPQVGRITVSVGFTALRQGDSPSGAFERADRALYFAKQNGRNQIQHYAALVSAGSLVDATRDSDVELF
jgi:diguanylate cyclase (GGDEF)-like protein